VTGYSLVLVPRSAAGELAGLGRPELWVRGDADQILAEVAAAELPIRWIYSADANYENTLWEPLTYTFDYLTALSLLTGVVVLVGLLLYLEAQTPLRRRAYVLVRRMGMSRGSHRRALLGELALPLLVGLLGGVAMTAGIIAAIGRTFDVNPANLPNTVLDVPYPALAAIGVMAVVVGIAAVTYAQARIARAQPSEVLRDAD
jgi:putative ABC transport system permease protein